MKESFNFMQRLHRFIPQTQREKSLVVLFSVVSSVVTSVLMTQEWFSGYTKASKSVQADSPSLVLGDPIVLKDSNKKSPQREPGIGAPGIVTGGRSPSEYAVTRGFSQPQSVSLIKINRWECPDMRLCYRPNIEKECQEQDQTVEFNQKISAGWKITSSHPDSVGATAGFGGTDIVAQCIGTRYILSSN